jgi:predicted ester cyclase
VSAEENKALARRGWETFAGRASLDGLEEFYADDYVGHQTTHEVRGVAAQRAYVAGILAAFPDLAATVEDQIAEGDKVVSRVRLRGTHRGELYGIPPTGTAVEFGGISIARLSGGKVVEEWEIYDDLGLLQQVGAFPASGAAGAGTEAERGER